MVGLRTGRHFAAGGRERESRSRKMNGASLIPGPLCYLMWINISRENDKLLTTRAEFSVILGARADLSARINITSPWVVGSRLELPSSTNLHGETSSFRQFFNPLDVFVEK